MRFFFLGVQRNNFLLNLAPRPSVSSPTKNKSWYRHTISLWIYHNPTGANTSSLIKQIFDSKMFFLGQHHLRKRKTTLEDVSQQRALQPKECLIIAVKIAKAIATLHRTELVHGQICLQHIFVVEKEEVGLML